MDFKPGDRIKHKCGDIGTFVRWSTYGPPKSTIRVLTTESINPFRIGRETIWATANTEHFNSIVDGF